MQAGTVPDGVTHYQVTASLVDEEVDNYFILDGPERNFEVYTWRCHVIFHQGRHVLSQRETTQNTLQGDSVKDGSRQSESYFGGEVTASCPIRWRRQVVKYIYTFLIFIHCVWNFGETLRVQTLVNLCMIIFSGSIVLRFYETTNNKLKLCNY